MAGTGHVRTQVSNTGSRTSGWRRTLPFCLRQQRTKCGATSGEHTLLNGQWAMWAVCGDADGPPLTFLLYSSSSSSPIAHPRLLLVLFLVILTCTTVVHKKKKERKMSNALVAASSSSNPAADAQDEDDIKMNDISNTDIVQKYKVAAEIVNGNGGDITWSLAQLIAFCVQTPSRSCWRPSHPASSFSSSASSATTRSRPRFAGENKNSIDLLTFSLFFFFKLVDGQSLQQKG